MSRQFREIVPRREQEPQRDFWLRTVMRRTANPCRAASSSTRERQFPRGQLAKMSFDGRAQIGRWIRNPDRFAAEADGASFAVVPGFDADRFAAQENFRPNRPGRRFPGSGLEPLQLAFQPGGMAFDKLAGHGG